MNESNLGLFDSRLEQKIEIEATKDEHKFILFLPCYYCTLKYACLKYVRVSFLFKYL